MGTLAPSVQRMTVQKLGPQAWSQNVDVVGRMWACIRATVESWDLGWEKIRLYQDGLPVCGREAVIVTELAETGSPNHQLLLWLMNEGATLVGTESPKLLLEEYRVMKRILAAKNSEEAARIEAHYKLESRSLLIRRDEYIAQRINATLRVGETGLLFLGMLHSVAPRLAKDIRVSYPIYKPPMCRGRSR